MIIIGYLINILGRDVAVTHKTTHPVSKWLTDEQFAKATQSMEHKLAVRETLETLDGHKIIVNYIKKAR